MQGALRKPRNKMGCDLQRRPGMGLPPGIMVSIGRAIHDADGLMKYFGCSAHTG